MDIENTSQDTGDEIIGKAPTKLMRIRILDIRENETALRPVDRTNPEYLELLASVREHGVLETITVRECVDKLTQAKFYGLINGLQRFTAAKDSGFDEIDAKIIVADDLQVLVKQVILNAKRVETRPVEYSNQLKRIIALNQGMTLKELANMVSASEKFVTERLGLLKLNNDIAKFVDSGTIGLTNAYALAKLPASEQLAFKDRAISMTPQEFCPVATKRAKELNEANRKGKDAKPEEFTPTPRVRKLEELKNEYKLPTVGKVLLQKLSITDPVDAFNAGIAWAQCLDPMSIAQAKAKYDADKAEELEAKRRKAEERLERDKAGAVNVALGVKSAAEAVA